MGSTAEAGNGSVERGGRSECHPIRVSLYVSRVLLRLLKIFTLHFDHFFQFYRNTRPSQSWRLDDQQGHIKKPF